MFLSQFYPTILHGEDIVRQVLVCCRLGRGRKSVINGTHQMRVWRRRVSGDDGCLPAGQAIDYCLHAMDTTVATKVLLMSIAT